MVEFDCVFRSEGNQMTPEDPKGDRVRGLLSGEFIRKFLFLPFNLTLHRYGSEFTGSHTWTYSTDSVIFLDIFWIPLPSFMSPFWDHFLHTRSNFKRK